MHVSGRLIAGFGVILFLFAVGLGFIKYTDTKTATTELPGEVEVASAEPKTETSDVHSADGKSNLTVEKITQSSGNTIYSFYTSDIPEANKTLIYQAALPQASSLEISPNAWSPNYNKYIFLKETTGSGSGFLVFNASGDDFSNGVKYIDVNKGFYAKDNGFFLDNITGWDSETLLRVKASKGEEKANFWFEIPSGAVIRLAR